MNVTGSSRVKRVMVVLAVSLILRTHGIAATHTEQVLDCQYAGSGAHTHDSSCYDAAGNLVCPLVEREYHVHTEACYEESRELVCGQEESEGHIHTDDCYDEEGNLVCEFDESLGHTHSDACYQVTRTLTCGKEEVTETHAHGAGCFRTVTVEDATGATAPAQGGGAEQPSEVLGASSVDSFAAMNQTNDTVDRPAQQLEGVIRERDAEGNEWVALVVGVKAPEGALPAGSTVRVDKVYSQELEGKAAAAVASYDPNATGATWVYGVELRYFDAAGNEVKPAKKVELKISHDGIRTAKYPVLVRMLDEEVLAKYPKLDEAKVLRRVAVVNQLDEDTSTGNENTFLLEAKLPCTYVIANRVYDVDDTTLSPADTVADVPQEEAVDAPIDAPEDEAPAEEVPEDGADTEAATDEPTLFTGAANGVTVTAEVPVGAFADDVRMVVEAVDSNEVKPQVEDAIDSDFEQVTDIAAVDISFVDAEGNAVEPAEPVNLSLTSDIVLDAEKPLLVQVNDVPAVVEDAETVNSQSETTTGAEDTLRFEGTSTGTYAVVALETISTRVITASGETYEISVTYGPEAKIPAGATLEAEEILPDTAAYQKSFKKALEALEDKGGKADAEETIVEFARFFDIKIMVDGKEVEPKAPVEVSIAYADALEVNPKDNVAVVHFADKGIEVIEASLDEEMTTFTFSQDSFSVTGTIVTSDNDWPSSNGAYVMYVQYEGAYYAVAHDGSLLPITVDNGKIVINHSSDDIDADYLWNYEAQGAGGRNRFVYYNAGNSVYYLDPRESSGIKRDPYDMPNLVKNNSGQIAYNRPGYQAPNNYVGAQDNNIVGQQSQANAVPIQFATVPRTVTIHFVDRNGDPVPNVVYTGDANHPVTVNVDGTYSIPYNWERTTGDSDYVDLENDFAASGYSYASSHLAGTRDGTSFTHDGVTIDAVLRAKNNTLYFYSDCGDQNANPRGNLDYRPLAEYNFNGGFSVPKKAVNATTNVRTTNYLPSNTDKDVYVIMDPLPAGTSSGGGENISVKDPAFDKKLVSNGDGTYTLSLSVTGSAKNTEANPKANVVFIVDTSSSMRKNVNNPDSNSSPTRLEDTKLAVADFAQKLLSNNTTGVNSDKIEATMVTFDGAVVSNGTWYTTYNGNGFEQEVNKLIPNNMHTGTDWEDALDKAYELGRAKKADGDATYVVFFTDGEPSQYTNFNGTGEYTGQNRGYRYWYNYFLSREAANDEARAIVNDNMTLYSIFAYNPISNTYAATGENGSDMLHNLTKYAYNTTADLSGNRFFLAQTTGQLNDAFAKILNSINEYVGVTDVKVNDNITSLTSVGITDTNGVFTGFKYTRAGGQYAAEGETWDEAPSATYDSNGVHWDLGNELLEEGVTYKVSFVVWPSQDAYDWVADLNNGIRTWEQLEAAGLDSHFIREVDPSTPSGYRYEVATNPPSKDNEGHIIDNLITYTKTHRETVGHLPTGVTLNTPVEETDPVTGTKTTTTYTQNPDGSYTKAVVTEARTAFGLPDLNMGLEDTKFKVQKKWVVSRPEELVAFLYNTATGDLIESSKNIVFDIYQGSGKYTDVTLGYKNDGFDWGGETQEVEVKGRTYTVGTIWEEPLDIAVGLMLSPERAAEEGIDLTDPKYIPLYESEDSTEVLYYVLEVGHDYHIDEPTLDYRFDFNSEVYHPMLVDSFPRDAKIEYKTVGGRTIGILKEISPENEKVDTLTGENILRGELKIEKFALDQDGNPDNSAEAKAKVFPMTVTLFNDDAPFYNGETAAEHNVPWYGVQINGEGDYLYYHTTDEHGNVHYAHEHDACVDGDYTHGVKDGYEGNSMTETQDHKTATATIYVSPRDVWTITNIPGGTTYTINEGSTAGYVFVSAEELESDPENKVTSPDDSVIMGTIHSNHVTKVDFVNRKNVVPIDVTLLKVDENDLDEENPSTLPGATFIISKYVDDSYLELDDTFGTAGTLTLADTGGTGTFTFAGLTEGFYKISETKYPDGYIGLSEDPLFEVRRNDTTGVLEVILLNQDKTDAANNRTDMVVVKNGKILFGNEPGSELPAAGGPGSVVVRMAGLMLVAAGFVALLVRRREA